MKKESNQSYILPVHNKDETMEKQRPPMLMVIFAVSFYFIISLTLVFVNKIIMDKDTFPYPLFMTWIQFIIQLICFVALCLIGRVWKPLSFMPKLTIRLEYFKIVLPLSFIYISMITLNNLCLQLVEVSFYQVARSLTIIFSLIFTYTILNKKTNTQAIGACGIVVIGYILGSVGEINFSLLGSIFGLMSSVFVALYGIYIKKILSKLNNSEWLLLQYNTIIAIVLLFPIVIVSGELSNALTDLRITESYVIFVNITGGLFGFLINIAIFLQVKYTSALSNSISGTLKACVQTILAFLFFQNPVSFTNLLGIVTVIVGSAYYSYLRYLERLKSQSSNQVNENNNNNGEK
eukprot:TRINITY_DN1892_c2_g1_i1.p1 TRINITY_DN1892_c2_g1~~TRINITY_DN1892_c2_g1_i1.p1  ORF type:complete len:349 (+),score=52.15 TRINITY_DN1892_c2_g1_i1:143-1189(+)